MLFRSSVLVPGTFLGAYSLVLIIFVHKLIIISIKIVSTYVQINTGSVLRYTMYSYSCRKGIYINCGLTFLEKHFAATVDILNLVGNYFCIDNIGKHYYCCLHSGVMCASIAQCYY